MQHNKSSEKYLLRHLVKVNKDSLVFFIGTMTHTFEAKCLKEF